MAGDGKTESLEVMKKVEGIGWKNTDRLKGHLCVPKRPLEVATAVIAMVRERKTRI